MANLKDPEQTLINQGYQRKKILQNYREAGGKSSCGNCRSLFRVTPYSNRCEVIGWNTDGRNDKAASVSLKYVCNSYTPFN